MARTIRTNTASGAATSASLSSADVQKLIDDRVQWTLDYEKIYTSQPPAGQLDLIPTIDTAKVAAYRVEMQGFAPNSGSARMYLYPRSGGGAPSGTTYYAWWGTYGTSQYNGYGSDSSFSSNNGFQPNSASNDSIADSNAQNRKEIYFYFNAPTDPGIGPNIYHIHYVAYPGNSNGGQGLGTEVRYQLRSPAIVDGFQFGFGGAYYNPSTLQVNPFIRVYKQLRVPAS